MNTFALKLEQMKANFKEKPCNPFEEANEKERNLVYLLEKAGVPKRFLKKTLENYIIKDITPKDCFDKITRFLSEIEHTSNKSPFLVLLSTHGTGKTHLGIATLRKYGAYGLYITMENLMREIQCSRNFSSETNEKSIIKKYSETGLLVIDELGQEDDTKHAVLFSIINHRYNNYLPTVLISNFNKNDFANYMGKSIVDRISECNYVIDFSNDISYRKFLRKEQ